MSTPSRARACLVNAEEESVSRRTAVVRPGAWRFGERSTAERTMKERGEEVLGLTERFPLHRTQALHSLNPGRELLLAGDRWYRDWHQLELFAGQVGDRCTRHVVGQSAFSSKRPQQVNDVLWDYL